MRKYSPSNLPNDQLDRLLRQIELVDSLVETNIVPESVGSDWPDMTMEQMKAIFQVRLGVFTRALRADRLNISDELRDDKRYLRALNNLDNYIIDHEDNKNERTLRPRQFESLKRLRDFLERGGKSGYFKLPTGYGKTILFIEFLEAIKLRTLIVVPTQVLIGQTQDKFSQFAQDVDVGLVYQLSRQMGRSVTVTTYQSLLASLEDGDFKPEDYDCLILDEVHQSLTENRIDAANKFQHAIRLGFTATPRFSKGKNVAQLLGDEIDCMEIGEAIKEDMLSSVRVILAQTNVDLTKLEGEGEDYSLQKISEAVNTGPRNRAAVDFYRKYFDDKKAIAYCAGINHAQSVADAFNNAGVPAAAISGNNTAKEKIDILEAHHRGDIQVICNADILIEGYDEPEIELCLNLRPTYSLVTAEQRGGRAVRLDPDNPFKITTIVDFIDKTDPTSARHPISFADILGAPQIIRKEHLEELKRFGTEDDVIHGIEFIADPARIQTILDSRPIKFIDHDFIDESKKLENVGWLNLAMLSDELDVSEAKLSKFAATAVEDENPELIKKLLCRLSAGDAVEVHFFDPKSLPVLREAKELNTAPDGWLNSKVLFDLHTLDWSDTRRFLDSHPKKYEGLYGKYLFPDKYTRNYFSPELVELMVEYRDSGPPKFVDQDFIDESKKLENVGWLNLAMLSDELDVSVAKLTRLAATVAEGKNPELIKKLLRRRSKGDLVEVLFIDPEGLPVLREAIELNKAPDGWISSKVLFDLHTLDWGDAKYFLDSHPKKYEGLYGKYLFPDKRTKTYFSPELVKLMVEDIGRIAPTGWKTLTHLSSRLGMKQVRVKGLADQVVNESPNRREELITFAKARWTNRRDLCYSPDIADGILRLALEHSDRHIELRNLAKQADTSLRKVRDVVDETKLSHKLIKLTDRRKTLDYILVKDIHHILIALVDKKGWKSLQTIAEQSGITKRCVTRAFNEVKGSFDRGFNVFKSTSEDDLIILVSKELITAIKDKISETSPQKNWSTVREMALLNDIDRVSIRTLIKEVGGQEQRTSFINRDGLMKPYYPPSAVRHVKERATEINNDWTDVGPLAAELGETELRIVRIAAEIRQKDYSRLIFVITNNTTFINPEIVGEIREIVKETEAWIDATDYLGQQKIGYNRMLEMLKELQEQHPDLFRWGVGVCKKRTMRIHPTAVGMVDMKLKEIYQWTSAKEITNDLRLKNFEFEAIKKHCAGYKNPEVIPLYKGGYKIKKVIDTLIGPELESKIRDTCRIPNGWLSFEEVAREYELERGAADAFLDNIREHKPDSIKVCWNYSRNILDSYIDPSNMDALSQLVANAPEGWQTVVEIMKLCSISREQFTDTFVDYQKKFSKSQVSKKYRGEEVIETHYSPEFVESISAVKRAPEGWQTYPELADECECHPMEIKKLADRLGAAHAKWQKKYFDPTINHERIFLHPDLIELIENKLLG